MDNGQDANTNPKSFEDMSNASANSNDTILLHKAQPMHQRGEKQRQLLYRVRYLHVRLLVKLN
jgi:hypothetical protein